MTPILLILNRRHLERVLRVFIAHYNTQWPHRALDFQPPRRQQRPPTLGIGELHRHDRLDGLIHEYYRDAPWPATRVLAPFRRAPYGAGHTLFTRPLADVPSLGPAHRVRR